MVKASHLQLDYLGSGSVKTNATPWTSQIEKTASKKIDALARGSLTWLLVENRVIADVIAKMQTAEYSKRVFDY